jgi:Family of unknown function (DUF6978)
MMEQGQADYLLGMPKVYAETTTVDLSPGADTFYILGSDDETETFFLDVYRGHRNLMKARFQLRHRRDVVLARLCTSAPHTNPGDDELLGSPHFHRYREGFAARFAELVDPFADVSSALNFFCDRINLPYPDIQGDAS